MADTECAAKAEQQHGVLTRRDALEFELTARQVRRRAKTGRWHRELPSVFRLAGAPRSWKGRLLAAVLWAEKQSAQIKHARVFVSHASAARLHGFPGFEKTERIELTTGRHLRHRRVTIHATKKRELRPNEVTHRVDADVIVTTPERTLLDLANRLDLHQLARCVDFCLRERKVSLESLQRTVDGARGRRGVKKFRHLVEERTGANGPSESELEARGLELIEAAGLPAPTKQVWVKLPNGKARVDFIYAEARVVVECDGYAWHSDIHSFEKDRERQNKLMAQGYRLLRWTWKGIKDRPEQLAEELEQVLASRS